MISVPVSYLTIAIEPFSPSLVGKVSHLSSDAGKGIVTQDASVPASVATGALGANTCPTSTFSLRTTRLNGAEILALLIFS